MTGRILSMKIVHEVTSEVPSAVGKTLMIVDTPVTDVAGRQRLRSATHQLMVVPRHRLSTVGR